MADVMKTADAPGAIVDRPIIGRFLIIKCSTIQCFRYKNEEIRYYIGNTGGLFTQKNPRTLPQKIRKIRKKPRYPRK
jgi:hypothetical protein